MISNLSKWQNKLLPYSISIMTLLMVAFLAIGTFYTLDINKKNDELISKYIGKIHSNTFKWNTLSEESMARLILEEKSMNYRYISIINTNKYTVWMRFSAYLIGAILCFIGAIFILSKISEQPTSISGNSGDINVALKTASPGIILALLGTLLIIFGMYKSISYDASDSPRYFKAQSNIQNIMETRKSINSEYQKKVNRKTPLE